MPYKGFDLILEMLANVNLDHDLTMIAPKGRIVVIGNRGRIVVATQHTDDRVVVLAGIDHLVIAVRHQSFCRKQSARCHVAGVGRRCRVRDAASLQVGKTVEAAIAAHHHHHPVPEERLGAADAGVGYGAGDIDGKWCITGGEKAEVDASRTERFDHRSAGLNLKKPHGPADALAQMCDQWCPQFLVAAGVLLRRVTHQQRRRVTQFRRF